MEHGALGLARTPLKSVTLFPCPIFCRLLERRCGIGAGMRSMLSWCPVMLMSTTRHTGLRSSEGCWKRPVCGSVLSPSRTGEAHGDFMRLGSPRLFFGITAGNLDSMVSNYTSHKKARLRDAYSPGGRPGLRPDRATVVYSNRVREAFGHIPIILGGIEASLRRLAHYDWWDNKVRRSLLLDAKADILVYGMGETQVLEIARRLDKGTDLSGIRAPSLCRGPPRLRGNRYKIPSYEEVADDKDAFNRAFMLIAQNQNPFRGKALLQRHNNRFVVQFPPARPLAEKELDAIYKLPLRRMPHPSYEKQGGVPGFQTTRFSRCTGAAAARAVSAPCPCTREGSSNRGVSNRS